MVFLDLLAVLSNSPVFILWAWGEILYSLLRRQPYPEVPDWGAGVPAQGIRRWYVNDKFLIREEAM